jgi:hypothetical protein
MPACFQLLRKTDGEAEKLNVIDDKVREHFGAPPDDKKYYLHWYDLIGFHLAMGRTFEAIIEELTADDDPQMLAVAHYLDENYTARGWYQRSKDIPGY